jgi:hypothetical protein
VEGQEGLVGLVPLLRVDLLLALGNGLGLGRVEAEEVVGVHLARRGRRLVLAGILGRLLARLLRGLLLPLGRRREQGRLLRQGRELREELVLDDLPLVTAAGCLALLVGGRLGHLRAALHRVLGGPLRLRDRVEQLPEEGARRGALPLGQVGVPRARVGVQAVLLELLDLHRVEGLGVAQGLPDVLGHPVVDLAFAALRGPAPALPLSPCLSLYHSTAAAAATTATTATTTTRTPRACPIPGQELLNFLHKASSGGLTTACASGSG